MIRFVIYLCMLLIAAVPKAGFLAGEDGKVECQILPEKPVQPITPMKALDMVRVQYANNFEKIITNISEGEYYYKLPSADYYLVYEGTTETGKEYLCHLYEFVIDEPDTGIGHTVTYGWYTVDIETGEITKAQ